MSNRRHRASSGAAVINRPSDQTSQDRFGVVSRHALRTGLMVLALALLLLLTATPTVAAGEESVNLTTTVERVSNGSVMVESTVSVPDGRNVAAVIIPPTGRTTVQMHTFDKERDGRYLTQSDARIRYRINPQSADDIESVGDALPMGTDEWALVPAIPRVFAYERRGGDPRIETTTRIRGPGSVGDPLVFLGDTETVTRDPTTGTSVRLIVPHTAELRPSEERVIDAIVAADSDLDVADTNHVNIFVAPSPVPGGGQALGTDIWVGERSGVDGASTWLHEFVHTQQQYRASKQMRWFTEASAEYYATLLAAEQGQLTRSEFEAEITGSQYENDKLADPDTWNSSDTPYVKGPRVLAALDVRVRNATNSSQTLEDVFVLMNNHEGKLTYEDFTDYVAEVAGVRMDTWLSIFIHKSEVPNPPRDPARYGYSLDSESTSDISVNMSSDEPVPEVDSGSDGGVPIRDSSAASKGIQSLYIIGVGCAGWILMTALSGAVSLLRRPDSAAESSIPDWVPQWGRRLGFALFISSLFVSVIYMAV